jgi:hypothetical protein
LIFGFLIGGAGLYAIYTIYAIYTKRDSWSNMSWRKKISVAMFLVTSIAADISLASFVWLAWVLNGYCDW